MVWSLYLPFCFFSMQSDIFSFCQGEGSCSTLLHSLSEARLLAFQTACFAARLGALQATTASSEGLFSITLQFSLISHCFLHLCVTIPFCPAWHVHIASQLLGSIHFRRNTTPFLLLQFMYLLAQILQPAP